MSGSVQGSLSQDEFRQECAKCQKRADDEISWAQKLQQEYAKAAADPANDTGPKVQDAVEKSLKAQGSNPVTAGTTDPQGNIQVQKQKGPCARLIEDSTLGHEQVHQCTTLALEKKYGKDTPEFWKAYNDPKGWADDEINAYQSDIDYFTRFKNECKAASF